MNDLHMASVYVGSYLTMAVTSRQNNQEGFIEATAFYPLAKLTNIPGTMNAHVYARPYRSPAIDLPLQKRSWVFQETLLPPRVLSFSSLEMGFQCDESETSESGRQDNLTPKRSVYNTADTRSSLCSRGAHIQ